MEKLLIIGTFLCVRFNLNLLECKALKHDFQAYQKEVLISTYWNVKKQDKSISYSATIVLISTYWNVKIIEINSGGKKSKVLISTYWNVKHSVTFSITSLSIVLISTYWNVKRLYTAWEKQ